MQGEQTFTIDVSELPAGMYFVKLQAGENMGVRKMVVR